MTGPKLLNVMQPLVRQAQSLVARLWRGTTLGVRVIAFDGDRLLLVRHTYVAGWHLPGGGVHAGETAEAAARRELLEETGYEANGAARFLGLYFNPVVAGRDHVAVYHMAACVAARAFRANHEIAECGAFPLDRLPEGTTAGTRRRLAELLEGLPPSDHW